ncbi:hypothetical protein COCON_G00040990 [Conger conger]|uniref:Uncharacterized protein n=1 Tax=Conger conger TaxID=82655 RepID=A0A9Q1I4K3_CONCO|nr:hypothetical protein COCON_G00040990 [Conger conger]
MESNWEQQFAGRGRLEHGPVPAALRDGQERSGGGLRGDPDRVEVMEVLDARLDSGLFAEWPFPGAVARAPDRVTFSYNWSFKCRDVDKARAYPLGLPEDQRVVLRLNVGRVTRIDHQGHPLQKTWHDHGVWKSPQSEKESEKLPAEELRA